MKRQGAVARVMSGLVLLAAVGMTPPMLAQGQGEPAMSPEQKAQMEAWMKAMTPGKEHQDLAGKTGTWEGTSTMWDSPSTPPQVSQVRAERKMGLGGRVLLDSWSGIMMGMPFEGMGTTGFNNVDGKWWGTWVDNFSTGVMTTTGNCDADQRKGCTFAGTYVDPMSGKTRQNRQIVSWPSADDERMEMLEKGADGKEWKMMEIVIRRVKK
jgi:hypothetical protein